MKFPVWLSKLISFDEQDKNKIKTTQINQLDYKNANVWSKFNQIKRESNLYQLTNAQNVARQ